MIEEVAAQGLFIRISMLLRMHRVTSLHIQGRTIGRRGFKCTFPWSLRNCGQEEVRREADDIPRATRQKRRKRQQPLACALPMFIQAPALVNDRKTPFVIVAARTLIATCSRKGQLVISTRQPTSISAQWPSATGENLLLQRRIAASGFRGSRRYHGNRR